MDGRMVEKVVGRVMGRRMGGWNGGWWEDGGRVVGGGWRIVGGVVVEVGFLSSCNGDLRDPLVLPQRSQVSF